MTPDDERLQRYLEWRRACDRERAERRRRVVGYVAVPVVFLLVVGLATWLGRPRSGPASTVTAVSVPPAHTMAPAEPAPAPQSATSAPAPAPEAPAPPSAPPAVERREPPARPKPRPAPRVASRPREPAMPASRARVEPPVAATPPSQRSADAPPDVAAGIAPAPPSPVAPSPTTTQTARETPSVPRYDAVPPPQTDAPSQAETPTPAPSEVVRAPEPRDVVAVPTPPRDEPVHQPIEMPPTAVTPPAGGAVAVAPPTVRERVTRWAHGEVDEFRDGVKREIRQFRSGYEKVRDFFRR